MKIQVHSYGHRISVFAFEHAYEGINEYHSFLINQWNSSVWQTMQIWPLYITSQTCQVFISFVNINKYLVQSSSQWSLISQNKWNGEA